MSADLPGIAICGGLVALDIAVVTARSRAEKRSRRKKLIVDEAVEQRLRDLTTVTVETMLGAAAHDEARYEAAQGFEWSPEIEAYASGQLPGQPGGFT